MNKVKMTLIGVDGNAFALIGAFAKEAKRQGWSKEQVEEVTKKAMKGSYDELLCTLMENIEDNFSDSADEDDEPCPYCSGDCPNDEDNACDGYLGDIDQLCEKND